MRALWLIVLLAGPAWATSLTWLDGGVHVTQYADDEEYPTSSTWYDAFSPRGREADPVEDQHRPSSLVAPDGSRLKFTLTNGKGRWEDHVFTPSITFSAAVERGAAQWPLTLPSIPDQVFAWWSPDSRRALLEVISDDTSVFLLVPGAFPRVQVLYPPRAPLDAAALAKVDRLAAQAGCVVAFAGEMKQERPKTVVYAAKGSEAQAKVLAGLLPGGATVEPLTWKVNASLVIAVGASFSAPP